MFYKPDECGLDFSGVSRFLASPVLSLYVWSSLLYHRPLPSPFSLRPLFPRLLFLLPFPLRFPPAPSRALPLPLSLLTDTELLRDYADPTFLPPFSCAVPAREANFCINRSAPKINVGWRERHFISRRRSDRSPVPSYLDIGTAIESAFIRILRSSGKFIRGRGINERR